MKALKAKEKFVLINTDEMVADAAKGTSAVRVLFGKDDYLEITVTDEGINLYPSSGSVVASSSSSGDDTSLDISIIV